MRKETNLIGQKKDRTWTIGWLLGLSLIMATDAIAGVKAIPLNGGEGKSAPGSISLTLRQVDVSEAMEMLSRKEQVNIILSDGVSGDVSVNLHEVSLDQAIEAVAAAAGFAVERRSGNYFIVKRKEVNKYVPAGLTEIRTYKVQYTKPDVVQDILKNHVSKYGKITVLAERNLLVVEDTPEFLQRIERLLLQLDQQPKQILIEAKILEVTLRDSESFGVDWAKLFPYDNGEGTFGVQGLSSPGSQGLFFQLLTPNVQVFLDGLESTGRLRTLSTPKLLAMENQEAETVIGDRLGYRVTTTINQVTTESIEFLESGVILKVKPSVDGQGRIMLNIHPEVSNGSVSDDGIPSQTTTEVTTQMLVRDGQTVFIGGLMRRSMEQTKEGVPLLSKTPGVGWLFSNHAKRLTDTETIVLITPFIINDRDQDSTANKVSRMQKKQNTIDAQAVRTDSHLQEIAQAHGHSAIPAVPAAPVDSSAPRPRSGQAASKTGPFELWSDDDVL